MSQNLPLATVSGRLTERDRDTSIAQNMFVTMTTAGQVFGVPVLQVQDVLGAQRITRVPLAPPEVAGSLNLRGRIVTSIDVRTRLGLSPRPSNMPGMNVVVDLDGELYSLIVDKVGEVMSLSEVDYERNPTTLEARWREVSDGIYRLRDGLLIVLDIARLIPQPRETVA